MFKLRKYNGYDPFNLRKSPIPLFYRRGCYDAGLGANYYDMVISGYYNKLHEFNGSYFRACNLDDNFLKPYEEETSANIIFELRKNIWNRTELEDRFEMAREIPNQVRGLIGFLFNQSSIQAFNTILSEANNALVSRKLFKNQIGNFQIVWPYMSHLLNFLDLEYKEYLDKTFKFLKVLPSTSEAEANRFKNIALDVSFYVYDEKKVFITTPAWEMFFFMYLLFLYGIYFSFGIYHFGNGYDYRDFAREIQEPYEHFIRECVEYYYSDKIDIDFKGLFYKNFLADPELIQLFFDTIRNSYKEGQEFVLQRSEEDVRKFLNKHIMDSCLDWMGGFENLERFFLNSMLGQYIKMMVASDHDASDEKNFKFYEFGVNQKKVIDQVKNEQGVENLEDYFYFYWDFNITGILQDTWEKNLYDGVFYWGQSEFCGLDPKTPLYHKGLVSRELKQNLSHWIKGLKNSWGMADDELLPICGLYLGKEDFTNKLSNKMALGDYRTGCPSPFYEFSQHYLLNHCDLGSLRNIGFPALPRWKPY